MKDLRTFLWILKLNKGRNWRICLLSLFRVMTALLSVSFALMTKSVVDGAIAGLSREFWTNVLGLIAIALFQILLAFFNRHLSADIIAGMDIGIKRRMFTALLRKNYSSVSMYHSGVLMNRINDDVKTISDGIAEIIPGTLGVSVRLVAAFCAVCVIDLRFALVFLTVGIAAMICASALRSKMKRMQRAEQEATERSSGFMQESVGNLLMIKTFGAEEIIGRRGDNLFDVRKKAIKRRKTYGAFMSMMMNIAFHGGYVMGLSWCAVKIATQAITVGTFSAIIQLIGQIEQPLTTISGYIPRIAMVLSSAERIREILELPEEKVECPVDRACYDDMTAICGKNVTFGYDRELILNGVDFTLKKGEFAVMGGTSGIGKSTLMKLLLGVYTPSGGQLYIDAGEVIPLDCNTRSLFSYVPQGNFLLSGTIRENICMMKPDATETEIWEVLKVSDADGFVDALPDGLETVIGERGVGLSEGQLQRLAIARALLTDAPILLLDECTSALDEPTEERVLSNLRQMTNKTCLLISHKKAALHVCDSIITIKDGKVTKQEL